MLTVEVIVPLVGLSHALNEAEVNDFAGIALVLTTTPCTFEFDYNGDTYTGSIALSEDGLRILIVFNTPPLYTTLPAGMCLQVTCTEVSEGDNDIVCPNAPQTLDTDTKFAVLNEDGCQVGFVTFADIVAEILPLLDIPTTLCDLIAGGIIPSGPLVAADRVLTTQNGCDLKSVPQTDIVC